MADKQRLFEVIGLGEGQKPAEPGVRLRYIKLTNGEDIMCEIHGDVEGVSYIVVKDPFKVTMILMQGSTSASMGLSRWVPFSDERFMAVSKLSIIAMTSLSDEATSLYRTCQRDVTEESKPPALGQEDIDSYVPPKYLN